MGGRTVGKSCKMFEFEVMRAACSASGAPNAGFLETACFIFFLTDAQILRTDNSMK